MTTDNFTHAVVDDGDIIRKYRWSKREAKWYQDTHPYIKVVALPKEPVKPDRKSTRLNSSH